MAQSLAGDSENTYAGGTEVAAVCAFCTRRGLGLGLGLGVACETAAGFAFSPSAEVVAAGAFLRGPRGTPLSLRGLRPLGTWNSPPADGVAELIKLIAIGIGAWPSTRARLASGPP